MRTEVVRDLGDSAHDFLRVVWPAVSRLMQGGRIDPVETTAIKNLQRDLDVLAGIDAWQMVDQQGVMRGVASRIQWGDKSWDTFTLRKDRPNGARTEVEKRMAAYTRPDEGWLMPTITVQAYIAKPRRTGRLIRAGVCYTRDLLEFTLTHPCPKPRVNPEDGVLFDWYRWSQMKQAGYRVGITEGAA